MTIEQKMTDYDLFKKSSMQSFRGEYLDGFEYFEDAHVVFSILPKGYSGDCDEIPRDENFIKLNYGFDMWMGAMMEVGNEN